MSSSPTSKKSSLALMAILATLALTSPTNAAMADDDDDHRRHGRHHHSSHSNWSPPVHPYGHYKRPHYPLVAYKPVYLNDNIRRSCYFTANPWGPHIRGQVRGYWSQACYQPVRYANPPQNGISLNFLFD